MKRLPDWRKRLHACIKSRHRAAFLWAENNGAIFSAAAIEAMTGEDLINGLLDGIADPADMELERSERAKQRDLEHQLLEAQRELALRQTTAKSGRAAHDHVLRDDFQIDVEEQQQVVADVRDSLRTQAAVAHEAAQRVGKPILDMVEAEGGLEAMVTARLGEPLPGVLCAKEGDLVMAEVTSGGLCLGIVIGAHAAFVDDVGFSRVRLLNCRKAWRVPFTEEESQEIPEDEDEAHIHAVMDAEDQECVHGR